MGIQIKRPCLFDAALFCNRTIVGAKILVKQVVLKVNKSYLNQQRSCRIVGVIVDDSSYFEVLRVFSYPDESYLLSETWTKNSDEPSSQNMLISGDPTVVENFVKALFEGMEGDPDYHKFSLKWKDPRRGNTD